MNKTKKITVIRDVPPKAKAKPLVMGERVRLQSEAYSDAMKGDLGTVVKVSEMSGSSFASVRFDKRKGIYDMYQSRLESLDNAPKPAPEPKVEKVVVELTLKEAQVIALLAQRVSSDNCVMLDLFDELSSVPEVRAGFADRLQAYCRLNRADSNINLGGIFA